MASNKELKIKIFSALCSKQYDISMKINAFMKNENIEVLTFTSKIEQLAEDEPFITIVLVYREKRDAAASITKEGAERLIRSLKRYDAFMSIYERNTQLAGKRTS